MALHLVTLMASVVLRDIDLSFACPVWHFVTLTFICVAGVALRDVDVPFAWKVWHL